MNDKPFNARSDAPARVRVTQGVDSVGDDVPCEKCGAALDTGLECTECGHDMAPKLTTPARSIGSGERDALPQGQQWFTRKEVKDILRAALTPAARQPPPEPVSAAASSGASDVWAELDAKLPYKLTALNPVSAAPMAGVEPLRREQIKALCTAHGYDLSDIENPGACHFLKGLSAAGRHYSGLDPAPLAPQAADVAAQEGREEKKKRP